MREVTLSRPASTVRPASRPACPSWAMLLGHFYSRSRLPLPYMERLRGVEMPEPFRGLLVHSNDMTPTLERFHGHPLTLTVLTRERLDDAYLREVTLNLESDSTPVEYGAIRICLEHFPQATREWILAERLPLGKILQTHEIPHVGWPQTFFRIKADRHISALLRVEGECELFGRRNVLLDGSRRMLAEVIEVLPPVKS